MPLCIAGTVARPIAAWGRPMPIRGSRAAAWCRASMERLMPGAIAPPR
jgi:hypothetical protein